MSILRSRGLLFLFPQGNTFTQDTTFLHAAGDSFDAILSTHLSSLDLRRTTFFLCASGVGCCYCCCCCQMNKRQKINLFPTGNISEFFGSLHVPLQRASTQNVTHFPVRMAIIQQPVAGFGERLFFSRYTPAKCGNFFREKKDGVLRPASERATTVGAGSDSTGTTALMH